MNLDQIVRDLEVERLRIDNAIKALRGSGSSAPASSQNLASSQPKRRAKKKGKPMSEAVKAKLRAIYAKNHPGWKPKKK